MTDATRFDGPELSLAMQRRIIALMAVCSLILTADLSIASVTLPSIGRDLQVPAALLSWVVVATSLANAGLLIIGGKLVDRIGHRQVLVVGVSLYAVGCIGASVASSLTLLLAARAVAGVAIALITPASFSLITEFLPEGPMRHRALGVFGVVQGVALLIGLFLSGWVVSSFGWHAAFLLSLPAALIAIALTLTTVPKPRHPHREQLDGLGAVLAIAAMVATVCGISSAGELGILAARTLLLLGGAIVLFAGLAFVEHRVPAPMLPPALFRRPGFSLSALVALFVLGGAGGMMVLSQIVMQRILAMSAAQAGLGMLPYGLTVMACGQLAPMMLGRFQARSIIMAGLLSQGGGLLSFALFMGQTYVIGVLPGVLLCSAGSLYAFVGLMETATNGLMPAERGVGTATLFVCQQVGIAAGTSIALSLAGAHGGVVGPEGLQVAFVTLAAGAGIAFVSALFGLRRKPAVAMPAAA